MEKFIFEQMVEYLNSITFSGCVSNKDPRIDSISDEEKIAEILMDKFPGNIKQGAKRAWFDICITQNGEIYPTNIKSSSMKSADNASAIKSLIWTFTELPFEKIEQINDHRSYIKTLREERKASARDYYFIVYDKKNKEFFFNSLKSLKTITSNGNNLPFQINWGKNKERELLSEQDSYDRVITAFKSSIQKRLSPFDEYEKL